MVCCRRFKLNHGKDRPSLIHARRQQRVLYFCFLDPELGLIYIPAADLVPFHGSAPAFNLHHDCFG
jgi:hypothetical protein